MTNEEFFEKVKNEKIKWTGWSNEQYIIPFKVTEDGNLSTLTGIDHNGKRKSYYIYGGFSPTSYMEYFWEFYGEKSYEEQLAKEWEENYGVDDCVCRMGDSCPACNPEEYIDTCNHEWKATQLVFTTAYDCTKCGVKKEDI